MNLLILLIAAVVLIFVFYLYKKRSAEKMYSVNEEAADARFYKMLIPKDAVKSINYHYMENCPACAAFDQVWETLVDNFKNNRGVYFTKIAESQWPIPYAPYITKYNNITGTVSVFGGSPLDIAAVTNFITI